MEDEPPSVLLHEIGRMLMFTAGAEILHPVCKMSLVRSKSMASGDWTWAIIPVLFLTLVPKGLDGLANKEQRLRPPLKHQPLRYVAPNAGAISDYCSAMRSRASRADLATRGSAISFLTLASVASRDSRISFFSGILR